MKKDMTFDSLYKSVSKQNEAFEDDTAKAINRNITARNWLIGFYIVHYEQKGEDRAKYGEKTLQKLSEKLNKKSLSYRNLKLYRQFYKEFLSLEKPIYDYVLHEFASEKTLLTGLKNNLIEDKSAQKDLGISDCQIGQSAIAQFTEVQIPPETLFTHLLFTHFSLIMSVEDGLARTFYELETIKGVWTVRELKRQIETNYFERSAISSNPQKMSEYVQSKSQKRILVDDDYFFCDLVFYHRILKCHILIDLKASKIKYNDIAQMNLYLSYYKKNIMQKDDNPPSSCLCFLVFYLSD